MELRKITAYYSVIVGILNVILWTILISTGQVSDLEANIVYFSFHWISEFLMAGLLIFAGYLIISDNKFSTKVYFFATGMLIIAITGAVVFYSVIEFDLAFIIMGTIITVITTILALKNYEMLRNFFYFTMGIIIYAEINFLGNSLQNMDTVSVFLELLAMIFSVGLLVLSFKKEITFE